MQGAGGCCSTPTPPRGAGRCVCVCVGGGGSRHCLHTGVARAHVLCGCAGCARPGPARLGSPGGARLRQAEQEEIVVVVAHGRQRNVGEGVRLGAPRQAPAAGCVRVGGWGGWAEGQPWGRSWSWSGRPAQPAPRGTSTRSRALLHAVLRRALGSPSARHPAAAQTAMPARLQAPSACMHMPGAAPRHPSAAAVWAGPRHPTSERHARPQRHRPPPFCGGGTRLW